MAIPKLHLHIAREADGSGYFHRWLDNVKKVGGVLDGGRIAAVIRFPKKNAADIDLDAWVQAKLSQGIAANDKGLTEDIIGLIAVAVYSASDSTAEEEKTPPVLRKKSPAKKK